MYLSNHVMIERADRLTYILLETGLGKPMLEQERPDKAVEILTDTGVLMVVNKELDVLITAFYCKVNKAFAMYKSAGIEHIPERLLNTIKKNKQRAIIQDIIKY